MSFLRKLLTFITLSTVFYTAQAIDIKDYIDFGFKADKGLKDLSRIKADSTSIVGKNIIVKGNVFIPYGDMTVYADKAVVNFETKDLEAVGNIRVYRVRTRSATVDLEQLSRFAAFPDTLVDITGYTVDPVGNQLLNIKVYFQGDMLKASRVTGNLTTGMFSFNDFEGRYKTFVAKAKSGVRKPGGEIVIKDAEISSCEYLLQNHAHYSIKCGTAKIYPHQADSFGISGYKPNLGEHSIWAYDCWFKVFGMPVLYIPMFYKPKEESPGLFGVHGGYNSNWGAFFQFSKRFTLTDTPYSTIKLLADYYTKRGFGYGANAEVLTEYSKTKIFGYSIYDLRPYETTEADDIGRLTIPHYRYGLRLSNVTHITPRLDFRGQFALYSDYYFLNDYFKNSYNNNPEPITFSSVEYQFDRFSASIFTRVQTNNFYTTVENLPTFRLNFPRQEIFSNIFWEGQTDVGYFRMKWRQFDEPRTAGNGVDPSDYQSARFDTVNFLYYPIRLDWLTLVPRAGVRMTAYSNTSKQKVDEDDLQTMFAVEEAEGTADGDVVNYDNDGGSKVRFIGEVGLEGTTKFIRSWQNVKNAYWQLDGLRHVIEPYFNYTYITNPTVNRDNLYYFDEVDRIQEQNFIRLGIRQRIQTRRGNFGNEQIYNWFTIENYWDYFFQAQDGFNNVGDFVTKLYFNPTSKLSLITLFSIDAGGQDRIPGVVDTFASNSGINLSWLNKWEFQVNYKVMEDLNLYFTYIYQNPYKTQSVYSMGSNFTELEAGSAFDQFYPDRIQNLRFGVSFPITPDRKLRGAYEIYYDFFAGYIREQQVKIYKTIHCWEIAAEFARIQSRDSDGDMRIRYNAMVTLYLTGLSTPMQSVQRSTVNTFTQVRQFGG
ncbi:hypothetical protein P0136_09370 [Lentisphaerota bacterium ZTH]|nr:LPS-assembly protein LptD [Lentisphaerota bacterium]WET05573.1 hypothetical protein P0136_09370 [Lentisphaerota bacterium ZTH]